MAIVALPFSASNSGTNDWSDVYGNDNAIIAQVNGNLDANNIADGTITSAKITDGSIVNGDINGSAAIAGSKLDTGDGRLVQTTGIVAASGNITLTGSYADVTGATVTFTPDVACYALVTAVFDLTVDPNVADSGAFGTATGLLVVDGTPETATALLYATNSATALDMGNQATVSQVYRVALTAASHTLKLQAKIATSGAGMTGTCSQTNTKFIYQLVAQ